MQRMHTPSTQQMSTQKILGLTEKQLSLFIENVSEAQRQYFLFSQLTNNPEQDLTLTQVNDFELVFIIAFAQWGPIATLRFLQSAFDDNLMKLDSQIEQLSTFLREAFRPQTTHQPLQSIKEQIIYLLSIEQSKRTSGLTLEKLLKYNLQFLSKFITSSLLFLLIKERLLNKGIINAALPEILHLAFYHASHPQNINLYPQQYTSQPSIKKNKKNHSTWKLLLTKKPKLEERILDGKKVLVIDLEDKQQEWTLKTKQNATGNAPQSLPSTPSKQQLSQPRQRFLLPKPLALTAPRKPVYSYSPPSSLLTLPQTMQRFINFFSPSLPLSPNSTAVNLGQSPDTHHASSHLLRTPENSNTADTIRDLELSPEALDMLLSCLPPAELGDDKGDESNDAPSYIPKFGN